MADLFRIMDLEALIPELDFYASRSSGPGGQNVNKVNTKVELRFDVKNSSVLSEEEKNLLLVKLKTRINNEGILIITSQEDRSQLKNKENTIAKLYALITRALTPQKPRRPTRPTAASKLKRLTAKKKTGEKKSLRKPPLE